MLDSAMDFGLIHQMPASIMVLDRDLRYVTASQMYLETVGLRLEDLRGRYVFDAFPETEARRLPLEVSMRQALAGETNAIERLSYSIPDPKDRTRTVEAWWRCRHSPLRGADGRIDHLCQITENVTDVVRAEELHSTIAHEMQHRVSNLLSLVQIVARRTAGHAADLSAFMERFDERLRSMARTHSSLVGGNWNRMSIREMVAQQLQHGLEELSSQISVSGPDIALSASEAQMLSMAIHELTTNSLKYGALKDASGRLDVVWARDGRDGFTFSWTETGVATARPSERSGFGSMILDTIAPNQLGGTAVRNFGPDGLRYVLTVGKPSVSA